MSAMPRGCPKCQTGTLARDRQDTEDLKCLCCGWRQYGHGPEAMRPDSGPLAGRAKWLSQTPGVRQGGRASHVGREYQSGRTSRI